MSAIRITQFKGEARGITPRLIPPGFAQSAENIDVAEGSLRPARGAMLAAGTVGVVNPSTIYRYAGQHWLAWGKDVDVVRSPLAGDPWKRVYWTGDGVPKMAAINSATAGSPPYPNTSRTLGIPAPDTIIQADPVDRSGLEGGEEPATALSTAYVHTYVSEYDEEGPPSDPSNIVTRWDDTDDDLNGRVILTIPPVSAHGVTITKVRLYRAESGGTFNYVGDLQPSTLTWTDSVQSDQLLGPVPSTEWDRPDASMHSLVLAPGGALAGAFDNTVCLSEAGYPHAWPTDYRHAFMGDVVGLAVSAAGIVVCTTGAPAVLIGATPAAMSPLSIDSQQPCLSKRSIVDMGAYVLYAGPKGIVAVGGQDAQVISRQLMTTDEWMALNPSSMHAYRDDDRYLCFYEQTDGTKGAFAFTPGRGFEFMSGVYASAGCYVGSEGCLYLADSSGDLKTLGQGGALFMRWKSGIYEVDTASRFTCGKVIAAAYPVTLRLYGDGILVCAIEVPDSRMFRLPPAPIAVREYEVELSGSHEIFSAQVAQSPGELI